MPCSKKQMEALSELLNDARYAHSKDWAQSDIVGRVEWLIASYESAKKEIARLVDETEETSPEPEAISDGEYEIISELSECMPDKSIDWFIHDIVAPTAEEVRVPKYFSVTRYGVRKGYLYSIYKIRDYRTIVGYVTSYTDGISYQHHLTNHNCTGFMSVDAAVVALLECSENYLR